MKFGSSRYVFFICKYAFKIPSPYSWRNFLCGLLANLQEVQFSKMKHPKLCPVLFHLPLGFLVVMPKVKTLNRSDILKYDLDKFCTEENNFTVPAELKPDSFGIYRGNLVAVDYG